MLYTPGGIHSVHNSLLFGMNHVRLYTLKGRITWSVTQESHFNITRDHVVVKPFITELKLVVSCSLTSNLLKQTSIYSSKMEQSASTIQKSCCFQFDSSWWWPSCAGYPSLWVPHTMCKMVCEWLTPYLQKYLQSVGV